MQKKRDFDQNYASIVVSILYILLSVGGFVGIYTKNTIFLSNNATLTHFAAIKQ